VEAGAGSFAFVMATGILSVEAAFAGFPYLSRALFALAGLAYVTLVAALRTRALRERTFAPFAFVAATGVVGTRFAVAGMRVVATALWGMALAAWIVLALGRRPPRPTPSVLLAVVGTQALAVLGAAVATGEGARPVLVAAIVWWALGLVLYGPVVVLLARLRPPFTPELWVLMGALAIATLAAAQLVRGARIFGTLAAAQPYVRDVGVATWSAATASIPLLAARDLGERSRWRYETARWSFVFPLGMYAAASDTLGNALSWHPLVAIGRGFFAVALAAWATVAAALVIRLLRRSPSGL
jgi:tellurite resistance protein TehA-like permease